MPPGRSAGDAGSLCGQGGVQPLAVGIKSFQHGQAFGQAFDEICFGNGHDRFFQAASICAIIAQLIEQSHKLKQTYATFKAMRLSLHGLN
jgi:hypothetical protein